MLPRLPGAEPLGCVESAAASCLKRTTSNKGGTNVHSRTVCFMSLQETLNPLQATCSPPNTNTHVLSLRVLGSILSDVLLRCYAIVKSRLRLQTSQNYGAAASRCMWGWEEPFPDLWWGPIPDFGRGAASPQIHSWAAP